MGLFSKSNDVLDLTLLQKRGLLKKEEDKEDVVDLAKLQNEIKDAIPVQAASPLSFFDNTPSVFNPLDSASQNSPPVSTFNSDDINHLKIKMDDLEFKLTNFLERLEKIESRVIDFERNSRPSY